MSKEVSPYSANLVWLVHTCVVKETMLYYKIASAVCSVSSAFCFKTPYKASARLLCVVGLLCCSKAPFLSLLKFHKYPWFALPSTMWPPRAFFFSAPVCDIIGMWLKFQECPADWECHRNCNKSWFIIKPYAGLSCKCHICKVIKTSGDFHSDMHYGHTPNIHNVAKKKKKTYISV